MTHAYDAAMDEALALAMQAIGVSDPNPRVGCVILGSDGRVLGRGHTQEAGAAHAEIVALRDAAARGEAVAGATVVVSFEPCAHHGRTPPCCDALVAARVGRVVVAMRDPFPAVAGQGLQRLRAAGIEVIEGPGAAAARELNIGFLSRVVRGTPWVRLKAAMSLDGRTALPDGSSQWITAEAARADGHAWRRRAGAVLTGVGTVREDDPRLDVRLVPTRRQPLRVVVDSRLDTPAAARILEAPGDVVVYAAQPDAAREAALRERGALVVFTPGADGKVDLRAVLADLADKGVNELHVEAGHGLNGSFVRDDLVDEFLVYVAPRLIGQGRELAAFGPLATLSAAPALRFASVESVGADLRIIARRDRPLPF